MKIIRFSIVFILFLLLCNCKNDKKEGINVALQSQDTLMDRGKGKLEKTQIDSKLSENIEKNYQPIKVGKKVLIAKRDKELILAKYNVVGEDKLNGIADSLIVDFKEQELLDHKYSGDDISHTYLFENFKITLLPVPVEGDYNFIINDTEYIASQIFDMGDLSVSNYSYEKEHIFIVHLEDYYGSLYFVYFFTLKDLYYAGRLSVSEPRVEEIGIKKKSFTVKKDNGKIVVDTFIDGELFGTAIFDKFKNISKAEN